MKRVFRDPDGNVVIRTYYGLLAGKGTLDQKLIALPGPGEDLPGQGVYDAIYYTDTVLVEEYLSTTAKWNKAFPTLEAA